MLQIETASLSVNPQHSVIWSDWPTLESYLGSPRIECLRAAATAYKKFLGDKTCQRWKRTNKKISDRCNDSWMMGSRWGNNMVYCKLLRSQGGQKSLLWTGAYAAWPNDYAGISYRNNWQIFLYRLLQCLCGWINTGYYLLLTSWFYTALC